MSADTHARIYTPEEDYMSGWKFAIRNERAPCNLWQLGPTWERGYRDGMKALDAAKVFADSLPNRSGR